MRHRELEAEGSLPLSDDGGDSFAGEPMGRRAVDAMLLQSNAGLDDGGSCVLVPATEALKLWNEIDPDLVRAMARPAEFSPGKKRSPARKAVVAPGNSLAREASPGRSKDAQEASRGKAKAAARGPPRPRQGALFARGKRTR